MRFIHIADVHLGAVPDLGYAWSENRAKEIWDSFARLIEQVKRERIELLLIAGDLFHGQPLMRECRELNFLLEQIPDTAVVLIAGNHDHIRPDCAYLKFPWAKNVIGLWGQKCQSCYIKSCNTYVYGFSYYGREITDCVYNRIFPSGMVNLKKDRPEANHILLAHGGDEKHVPIRFSELAETGFDYIALGHIHQPQIIKQDKMAYAGSLEPLDRNHLGKRGYIQGEIVDGRTSISFVPFATREYRELDIAVTPASSNGSVQHTVRTSIKEAGDNHIYKIRLCGYRSPEWSVDVDSLYHCGNVVDVLDETEPEYDFARLRQEYKGTAVAAYIESFGDGPAKQLPKLERKALYMGVHALLNGDS